MAIEFYYGLSGAGIPILTDGSILFASHGSFAEQNSKLFWDNSNFRLGIGTPTPLTLIHALSNNSTAIVTIESSGTNDVAQLNLTASNGSTQKAWGIGNRGTADSPNNRLSFNYDGQEKAFINSDGTLGGVTGVLGAWQAWTPSYTGFSSNPTTLRAAYAKVGKLVFIRYEQASNGTANSSDIRISLPVASKVNQRSLILGANATDNGSALTTTPMGLVAGDVDVNNMLVRKDGNLNNFSGSGTTGVGYFSGVYEAA